MAQLRSTRVLSVASVLGVALSSASAQVEIYDADAPVQSPKRGVAAGTLDAADFTALSPGVSWWYNYATTPSQTVPANSGMTFFPMVFDGDSSSLTSLSSYLAAGNRPGEILTINEPNISGQAVMTPSQAATVYQNVQAIAAPYGIPVSGPQMPTGGNTGVTSTSQYLSEFFQATSANSVSVYGTGIHIYDNLSGFTYDLSQAITNGQNLPLSVTEFDYYDATSVAEQLNYLIQTVNILESTPSVNYYSWFYARTSDPSGSPYISLLTSQAGVLSALGNAYVNMPVHEANVYYRPNGALQADRYVTMANESIGLTGDTLPGILADMTSTAPDAQLNYNLYAAQAGLYDVDLRVAGAAGNIELLNGSTPLNTVYMTGGTYGDVETQIYLNAGYDSLTVEFQNTGQVINDLDFTAVPEPTIGFTLLTGGMVMASRRTRPLDGHQSRRGSHR